MPEPRTILHVDMDAFFASVEQRDCPDYRGKPLVVGGDPHSRGVVAAASYEARTYGIRSAMPTREAYRRCPHAIFVHGRMQVYRAVSEKIFRIFEDVTPMVQPLSVDEAFLDVTGALHLWSGNAVAIAEHLRGRIRNELHLTASVGIAPNKFLAKLASDLNKPDGYSVVPRDAEAIRAFLAPMDVGRIWGVGKKTRAVLSGLGIETIRDLQVADTARLHRELGQSAADHLRALAFGLDERPVHEADAEKSISSEETFDEDQTDPARWRSTLLLQAETVGRRLRAAGFWAGCVQVKIRNDRFQTITRQQTLTQPTQRDLDLFHVAWRLLEKAAPERPLRLLGLGASHLTDTPVVRGLQLDLFDATPAAPPPSATLDRVVDQLRAKYGKQALRRGETLPRPPTS